MPELASLLFGRRSAEAQNQISVLSTEYFVCVCICVREPTYNYRHDIDAVSGTDCNFVMGSEMAQSEPDIIARRSSRCLIIVSHATCLFSDDLVFGII
jgi:hypothetical protein